MQWKNEKNAGFSTHEPWLPVPASYATHNVETESKDPNSVLNFYKRILALRHTNDELLEGAYVALNTDDPNVLSYLRSHNGKAVLVTLNMSGTAQKAKFDLTEKGFSGATLKTLAASQAEATGNEVTLQPFGAFVGEVTK
jgi:alpha-glucosidase